jgi:hypothetical protein
MLGKPCGGCAGEIPIDSAWHATAKDDGATLDQFYCRACWAARNA